MIKDLLLWDSSVLSKCILYCHYQNQKSLPSWYNFLLLTFQGTRHWCHIFSGEETIHLMLIQQMTNISGTPSMNEGLCQPLALFSKEAQTPNIKDFLSSGRKSYANHLWQVSVYRKKSKHGMLWKQAEKKYQTEPESGEGRTFWRAYVYIGIN